MLEVGAQEKIEPALRLVRSLHIGLEGIEPAGSGHILEGDIVYCFLLFNVHGSFLSILGGSIGLGLVLRWRVGWLDLLVKEHKGVGELLLLDSVHLAISKLLLFLHLSTEALLLDEGRIKWSDILIVKTVPLVVAGWGAPSASVCVDIIPGAGAIADEAVIVTALGNSGMNQNASELVLVVLVRQRAQRVVLRTCITLGLGTIIGVGC
mmetsp:Transcript_27073/g.63307  ORF Transcript_27073/g.63307 Transcript_27073/m.63307 type:complete len:208 (+) Transcript_27073:2675-3298(+)